MRLWYHIQNVVRKFIGTHIVAVTPDTYEELCLIGLQSDNKQPDKVIEQLIKEHNA